MYSTDLKNYTIKTFAKRAGRKLSPTKQNIKDNLVPKYLLLTESISEVAKQCPTIEIGFGKGENIIQQALNNKNKLYIGCEVFYEGVIALVAEIERLKIKNILVWPDDADILINSLPDKSCSGIFLLFSDPWTKKRHHKRRFLQLHRIEKLLFKLTNSASIYFASDIENYVENVVNDCDLLKIKYVISENVVFDNYITTRYHQKAIDAGRKVSFIQIFE